MQYKHTRARARAYTHARTHTHTHNPRTLYYLAVEPSSVENVTGGRAPHTRLEEADLECGPVQ